MTSALCAVAVIMATAAGPAIAGFPWMQTAAAKGTTRDRIASPPKATKALASNEDLPLTGPIHSAQLGSAVVFRVGSTSQTIAQAMEDISRRSIRNVVVETVTSGTAIYRSSVLPQWPPAKPESGDPLSEICAAAKANKLRVFASFQTLKWDALPNGTGESTHPLIAAHPDWLDRTSTGSVTHSGTSVYLCPASPEVQELLLSVTDELCSYPISGVCFSSLHYFPGEQSGYHPLLANSFSQLAGADVRSLEIDTHEDSAWMKWVAHREDALTTLAQQLTGRVRQNSRDAGRRIVAGVEVLPEYLQTRGSDPVCQNWLPWIRKSRMDLALPTCLSGNLQDLEKRIRDVRGIFQGAPVACLPILAINGQSANSLRPPYDSQIRVLESAGFRHCVIYDYEAYRRETASPMETAVPAPDSDKETTAPQDGSSSKVSAWRSWWS